MKIAIVGSAGGHLTELKMIFTKEVIGSNSYIILSESTDRTKNFDIRTYFFKQLNYNPLSYLFPILKCIRIFRKEKVKLVVTSGAQIGLVSLIAGKFLGIKTIYLGIAGNPKTPSLDGKYSYYFSDVFLVQYPKLVKKYGKKAKYVGGLL